MYYQTVYTPAPLHATGGRRRIFLRVETLKKKRQLTPEEEQIRKRGLRILARMIVRAHMDAQGIDGDGRGDACALEGPATDLPGKDGEHVG